MDIIKQFFEDIDLSEKEIEVVHEFTNENYSAITPLLPFEVYLLKNGWELVEFSALNAYHPNRSYACDYGRIVIAYGSKVEIDGVTREVPFSVYVNGDWFQLPTKDFCTFVLGSINQIYHKVNNRATLDPFFLVRQWRAAMGLKSGIINVDDERMMLHRRLFLEEMNELLYAIDTKDTNEIKDGFSDIIFVITGMMLELGHNPHEVFFKVYESNMSKVCYSLDEAIETVELYAKGLHPDKMGEKINTQYRSVENGRFFVLDRVSDGKVLKSKNYKPPRW